MNKTLRELIEIAAETYPDHFLQNQLENSEINVDTLSLEEVLAAYIAKEFRELYDPDSNDQQNARRIASSLERSVHTLERVTEQLRDHAQFALHSDDPAKTHSDEEMLANLLERLRPASG